ncbi:hypothetical protein AAY473_010767 [Plecturocebus cupreus]
MSQRCSCVQLRTKKQGWQKAKLGAVQTAAMVAQVALAGHADAQGQLGHTDPEEVKAELEYLGVDPPQICIFTNCPWSSEGSSNTTTDPCSPASQEEYMQVFQGELRFGSPPLPLSTRAGGGCHRGRPVML